jgi:hypothetical protein
MIRRAYPLRDFLRTSLAHPSHGYFAVSPGSVGVLPHPLEFGHLVGESGYRSRLRSLYRDLDTAWLTPVEIFRPHFGRAVAAWILAQHARHTSRAAVRYPLEIVEIGAGSGTLAADILDFLASRHPNVYKSVQYTTLEASPTLRETQAERVVVADPRHARRFRAIHADATHPDLFACLESTVIHPDRHVVVLGMELLDNMPHDRVERVAGASSHTSPPVTPSPSPSSHSSTSLLPGDADESTWYETIVEMADQPSPVSVADLPTIATSSSSPPPPVSSSSPPTTSTHGLPPWWQPVADLPVWMQNHNRSTVRLTSRPAEDFLIRKTLGAYAGWTHPLDHHRSSSGMRIYTYDGGQSGPDSSRSSLSSSSWKARAASWLDWALTGQTSSDVSSSSTISSSSTTTTVWLPTGAYSLLRALRRARPHHSVLLADFDALPDVQIGGRGAPLVSSTRGGQNVDFDTFLIAAGEADIFFPTDFDALCALYSSVRVEGGGADLKSRAGHVASGAFLRRWGDISQTVTLGG